MMVPDESWRPRACDATQRADKLERRLRELEGSTAQLQQMLKSAQEGIGVMKTIARIRNTGGATDGKGGGSVADAAQPFACLAARRSKEPVRETKWYARSWPPEKRRFA